MKAKAGEIWEVSDIMYGMLIVKVMWAKADACACTVSIIAGNIDYESQHAHIILSSKLIRKLCK